MSQRKVAQTRNRFGFTIREYAQGPTMRAPLKPAPITATELQRWHKGNQPWEPGGPGDSPVRTVSHRACPCGNRFPASPAAASDYTGKVTGKTAGRPVLNTSIGKHNPLIATGVLLNKNILILFAKCWRWGKCIPQDDTEVKAQLGDQNIYLQDF